MAAQNDISSEESKTGSDAESLQQMREQLQEGMNRMSETIRKDEEVTSSVLIDPIVISKSAAYNCQRPTQFATSFRATKKFSLNC